MEPRRVVVTGLGAVAPNGFGVEGFWNSIKNGVSGIGEISSFDASSHPVKIAGEVRDFDPFRYIDRKEARKMDRVCQFAMVAADEAVGDAGWKEGLPCPAERVGVIFASGIGGILTFEQQRLLLEAKGPRRVSPFMIPMLIINLIPGQIAIAHGLKGVNFSVVTACASSTHAIGEAYRQIKFGFCDAVVAGGAEAAITPLTVAAFGNMKALSTRNELGPRASSPFDKERDGFVIGEGAGALVLEEYETARRRGARIYAEIAGYGASCDAYHITAPVEGGEGLCRCLRIAMDEAGVTAEDISYVNAHGTSTPFNDKHETLAYKTVFGETAYRIPVSSTKSMTGHLLGAAGAIESVVCLKAMEDNVLPPTINLEHPDPECDLDYVPNEAREAELNVAVNNSMGFGGQNASVVFRRMR